MKSIDIALYKSSNKFQIPERHQLNSLNKLSVSENDYVYFEIKSNELFPVDTFIWLSDYRFNLKFEKKNDSGYYYSVMVQNLFASDDLDKFSQKFKIGEKDQILIKIFLNFFGLCEIELERKVSDEIYYDKVASIGISSNKITDVDYLLEYLF